MRTTRLLAGVAISGVFVFLLFRSLSLSSIATAFLQADLRLVLPALGVYAVGLAIRTARWQLLLRPFGTVPFHDLFQTLVIGLAANDVLPMRLGEIARAALLSRNAGIRGGITLASITVERVFDGLALCAFLLMAWPFLPLQGWVQSIAVVGLVLFASAVIALWLVTGFPDFWLRVLDRVDNRLPPRIASQVQRLAQGFIQGLAIVRQGRVLALVMGLSLLAWTVEAGVYYVIMLGFPLPAVPVAAMAGAAMANLGTLVPSSPGYVGTFDLPLQTVLTELFGASPEVAASYTLVVHAALVVPVVAAGLFFLWRQDLSLREIAGAGRTSPARVQDFTR